MKKKNLFSKNILIALALASISLWYVLISQNDSFMRLFVLDVGQGDAILINFDKNQILVDTGRGDATLSKVKEYMPYGDNEIELLVLSHLDSDHIGGTDTILDKIEVDEIWTLNWQKETETVSALKKIIEEKKILTKFVRAGETKNINNSYRELKVDVVSPDNYLLESDSNNSSLVLKIKYGDIDFLLTGDLEVEGEKRLIDKNIDLQSEVLKVGHHGSKSSTSQEFLDRVKPETSLVSVGKNSYGHPAQEVIDRLKSINSRIYRTDESGTIEIKSDGKTYTVKTEK